MHSATEQHIKIAIIGFSGLIGVRHTENVLHNSSTKLVALVDLSPVAEALAADKGVPLFRDVSDMLASDQVRPNAAIICTPNHTHVPIALELVDAGIHVLVEKPISIDVASGAELVRRAHSAGVQVLVGHHRRFNPYVIATKKAVDSGLIGDVTAVSALWTAYKPDSYFTASPALSWRTSKKKGGGVVLINLIHEIDLLQYFFGPIVRVHAEKTLPRRDSDDADRAEEGAAMTLRFKNGIVGTFILSDTVASPHFFEAGTGENPLLPRLRTSGADEIDVYRIFGTRGTLSVPDMTLWSYKECEGSWQQGMSRQKSEIDQDPRVPFERQLDHFVEVVKGRAVPRCSGQDGLQALAVCNAIRVALDSETGTVRVDEDMVQLVE